MVRIVGYGGFYLQHNIEKVRKNKERNPSLPSPPLLCCHHHFCRHHPSLCHCRHHRCYFAADITSVVITPTFAIVAMTAVTVLPPSLMSSSPLSLPLPSSLPSLELPQLHGLNFSLPHMGLLSEIYFYKGPYYQPY